MIEDYGQYDLQAKEKLAFGIILMVGLLTCSILFFRHWIFLISYPFFFWKGLHLLKAELIQRRKKNLLLEFRDFLFSLSASFSTGRHMTEAMKEAVPYLTEIHGQDSLLQQELRYMIQAVDETGKTDLEVLSDFADRVKLEDVYLFADVFCGCRETGGSLTASMHKAAFMISEKISIEQEIQTMVYQKKLEGRMIALMPFLILLFLQWMSPGYLDVMYNSAGGMLIMLLALVMTGAAYLWLERMTNLEF